MEGAIEGTMVEGGGGGTLPVDDPTPQVPSTPSTEELLSASLAAAQQFAASLASGLAPSSGAPSGAPVPSGTPSGTGSTGVSSAIASTASSRRSSRGCDTPPRAAETRHLHEAHLRSGTDEDGHRIRMFTATLTCDRAEKAGLSKFEYTGETIAATGRSLANDKKMRTLGGLPGRLRHGHGEIKYDSGNYYVGQWNNDTR